MAITLNPTIANLGIMAPVLGPWFSNVAANLPAITPAQKLGLTLNLPAGTDWLPPATGLLSLYISTPSSPPAALATLQDSDGQFPFPAGRIVAWFRLLPEVEARLHALIGLVPQASAATAAALPTAIATPTRPQIRSLALVLPAATPLTPAGLYPFLGTLDSSLGDTDAKKMAAFGLGLTGATLANGAVPMTWLRRPGGSGASQDKLLQGLSGAVDLWAFDRRGRAVDPGAVACWWSWLLNAAVGADASSNLQLLAPGIPAANYPQASGQPVVAQFSAGRTAHLVDAHEGPLGAPFIGARLQSGGSAVASNLLQATGNNSIALGFQALTAPASPPPADNPQLDNAPRARLAVLPDGSYAATATLWPGGPVHAGLPRDFIRVGVVEEELHLVGTARRDSRLAVATPADRRGSAQNRPSTRINVARTATTAGVLRANAQAAADALIALPNAATPTRFVLGLADALWGGTPAASAIPPGTGAFPTGLADSGTSAPSPGQYRVRALTGGGALAEDHQSVLVEIHLGAPGAGAWVRAWPQGFDLATGVHFQLTGGAGRADATGLATLVMVLANGRLDAQGLLGMLLHVVRQDATGRVTAQRLYADCRFTRPAPVGGTPATTVAGSWIICETAATGSGALPAGAVPPGGHVVLLSATPALLDRTTIPAAALDPAVLATRLQGTDIAALTAPAYAATPDRADATGRPLPRDPAAPPGNPNGALDTLLGPRLHRLDRAALTGVTASSVPYALMDRLEVAAATNPPTGPLAALAANPPVPWALEPATAFHHGHPGVPASIETHGTGLALSGAPAVAVAEYVRERTAGLGFAAVQGLAEPVRSAAVQSELAVAAEAATALPTPADGAGPGPVVAILRTAAVGMEGIPGIGLAATQTNIWPLSQNLAQFESWLDTQISAAGGAGTALRNAVGAQSDSISRALDRRIMTAAFGATEALTALLAAIARAQDFVYLETPAIDLLAIDPSGENRQLWQSLINRMAVRPGLRVALCVPSLLLPGTPKRLQEIRDHGLLAAITAMRAAAADRFALFSPGAGGGRAIRFASTSVIVDDAFALTGTTHLWRRGLTWDSSLAASVFDERLVDGRPQDVRGFRIQLMADRLGIPATTLPDDPAELVKAIRALDDRGSDKLSALTIAPPTPPPPNADIDTWNPDGTKAGLDLTSIATLFAGAVALTDTDHAIVEG